MKTFVSLSLLAFALAAPASAATLNEAIRADMPQLMALYRDLHAHPELSMQEVRSPAKLPVLMIRADMDGLPIVEQTGLPFASKVRAKAASGVETGVMHGCGHDTHMTAFIGTARRLAAMKSQWSGTLVMILQPGEETSEGAKAMLEDGLYTRFPKPNAVIAFHDAAALPAGMIGVTPGYALANVDSVDITVKGVGGHGAYPQTTKDPIVLASRIVTTLQTLVSRENDPSNPAVVTVGSFLAGAKHNIISDEAKLQLTVRSYTPEVRKLLLDGIKRIVRGEAIAAGMPDAKMPVVTVREEMYTPSTFNTEKLSARALELFTKNFGAARVIKTPAVMGGEDFSRFWLADKSIESLIFWVGGTPKPVWDAAKGEQAKLPSLHSPYWAPGAGGRQTVVTDPAWAAMTVKLVRSL